MAIAIDRVNNVIADIYAAVGNPAGFTPVLHSIRALLNGSSGMLFTPGRDASAGGLGFVDHFNTDLFSQYRAYYWDKDAWAREGSRKNLLHTGTTFTDQFLIPDAEIRKEEIYPDLMIPMDITRLCCSIVLGDEDPVLPQTHLSIYRGVGSRPFSEEERRILELLSPHVLQALRLARRLQSAVVGLQAAHSALHELRSGVLLVDAHGLVLFMNRAAETICGGQHGLSVAKQSNGPCVLKAALSREDAALHHALTAAISSSTASNSQPATAPVAIHGPNGKKPLLVTVLPLPAHLHVPGALSSQAIVIVDDPFEERLPGDQALSILFGLTTAERRVARALVAGEHPNAIAEKFGVSENTVRTQIRAIYDKTGCRGIGALVALLARLA